VTSIADQGYRLGETVVPSCTVWAAGVAAFPLGALPGVPLDRAGRVKVNPDLTLPVHPEVFVAGDLVAVLRADGRPVPGVAPVAKQVGIYVARALSARLDGGSAQPLVSADHGNLATFGRMAAEVDLCGFQFSGLLAWLLWLAAHVSFLIGFRTRVSVLLNWALAHWTCQRGACIVLGQDRCANRLP